MIQMKPRPGLMAVTVQTAEGKTLSFRVQDKKNLEGVQPGDKLYLGTRYNVAKGTLPVSDGAQANDKPYLASFPYLALPHEGFSGGHGMPTDK